MKTIGKIFSILFFLVLIACSSGNTNSAGSAPIYGNIGLRTRASKEPGGRSNISATATLRKKNKRGKRLILKDPAKIEINGQAMVGKKDFISRWHYSLPVINWAEQFEVQFTDEQGMVYTQTIRLDSVGIQKVPETPISRTEDWLINYSGKPLAEGEYFQLWIEQSGDLPKPIRIEEEVNGQLRIAKKYLQKRKEGAAKVTLDRIIKQPIPGLHKKSVLIGRFESQSVKVTFL